MTLVKDTIGRIPQNFGNYDSTKAYGKKNRVNLYGCEWESKTDNNTYAPATLVNGVVTPDTTHWRLVSGVPANYGLDGKVSEIQTSVNTLSQNKVDKVSGKGLSTNDYSNEEKKKVTDLAEAVGDGGSVDTRIAAAVNEEKTRAEGAESALDGRVDTLEEAVGTGGSVDTRISSAVATETTRAQAAESALQSNIEALTQSSIEVVADHTQVQNPDATTIYREYGTNTYSDWMYQNNTWQKMAEYDNAIDDEPTSGSNNLVKSDGVEKRFLSKHIYPEHTSFTYGNLLRTEFEFGSIDSHGNEYDSDTSIRSVEYIKVIPNKTYNIKRINWSAQRFASNIAVYDKDKNYITVLDGHDATPFTIPNNGAYIRTYSGSGAGNPTSTDLNYLALVMVEGTSPATKWMSPYEAYSENLNLPVYDKKETEIKQLIEDESIISAFSSEKTLTERKGDISSGVWHYDGQGTHFLIPIDNNVKQIIFYQPNIIVGNYTFLKNATDYCEGISDTTSIAKGDRTIVSDIPEDVKFLYVRCNNYNGVDCRPYFIIVDEKIFSLYNTDGHITKPLFVNGFYSSDLNNNDGISNENDYRAIIGTWIRTDKILYLKRGSVLYINSDTSYYITLKRYDLKAKAQISSSNYTLNCLFIEIDGYYAIDIRRSDYSNIKPEDIKDTLITYFISDREEDENLKAYFIGGTGYYAGGGDCTIFITPNGKNIMVDSSQPTAMSGDVRRAIYKRGIKQIDNVIISHYHSDHTGGLCYALVKGILDFTNATFYLPDDTAMDFVIDNMGEGEKFYGDFGEQSYATYQVIKAYIEGATEITYLGETATVEQFKGTVVYPSVERSLYTIDGVDVQFWNVNHTAYNTEAGCTYNDYSLCCDIIYGNQRICMTGDLGPIGEGKMTGTMFKSNILKSMHHGWENQVMNTDFINEVYPDIVVTEDSSEHDELIYRETSPIQSWCEQNGIPHYRTRTNKAMDFIVKKDTITPSSKMRNFVRGGVNWGLPYGDSVNRPKAARPGMQFFDTTLNKPIYWNSTAWVDATGTTV